MEGESMSEWKEVRLGDVCNLYSGGTPNKNNKTYWNGNIPWISAKSMYGDYIEDADLYITEEGLSNGSRLAPKGSILILTRGSGLYNRSPICYTLKDVAFNQDVKRIESKDEDLYPNDLLYYILYANKKTISSIIESTGIGAGKIDTDRFLNLPITIPPVYIQKDLMELFNAIFSKIETNNKLNEKLEEMAQAIFKSWFVDFEPFKDKPFHETELGMIPEGWEVVSLTDIATFTNGLAMQKFRPNYKEPHLPVLKIKELRQGFCDDTSEICIDDISDDFIADDGDIIFSWSGTLLVDIWCGGKCGVNQHLFKVTSEKYNKWFFYFWIKRHLAEFIRIAKDKAVTMGHIKRGHLTNALVVVPNEKTMQNADKIFTPIIDKIIEAKIESKRLASLRDTLLPRLMSGELIV